MVSVLQSAKVLVDPVDGMKAAVEARRWALPVAVLTLCSAVSAAAFASRWDASPTVIQQLEMSGDLQKITEQDLETKIVTAHRLRLVTGVLKELVAMPLWVLLVASTLGVAGWLFGARASFYKYLSVAALALLPVALFHVIFAVSVLRQPGVVEGQAFAVVPSNLATWVPKASPVVQRVLSAVDFFNLWSVGLLGLGLSAASGLRRSTTLAVAVVLYAAYLGVFVVGVPGMKGEAL